MKQVSFSLLPGQTEEYKALVDKSMQSKTLRHFIINEYSLPSDLTVFDGHKNDLKVDKYLFDEYTDERLNQLVNDVKQKGFKANRSSLMRHILSALIQRLKAHDVTLPKDRTVRHSTFYFEKGVRSILDDYISFSDRNARIERFILDEYEPSHNQLALEEKPNDPEAIRLSLDQAAFDKLDDYVKAIGNKKITRTSLMRDVVYQLINKASQTDASKLIAEKRLNQAISEYKTSHGASKLKEELSKYLR